MLFIPGLRIIEVSCIVLNSLVSCFDSLLFAVLRALEVSRLNATKVINQIGGNDLNNHCCQPEQLARDILHIARQLMLHDGVTKVAICQLCHRYPPSYQRSRSRAALRHPLRRGYKELMDEG